MNCSRNFDIIWYYLIIWFFVPYIYQTPEMTRVDV